MDYFFSASTRAFYLPLVHGEAIPADAVPVTEADHAALMAAQSAGKRIAADDEGRPVALDGATYTPPAIRRIRPLAFRRRMSAATRQAVTTAARTDAALQTFLDDLGASTWVELDHDETKAGVAALRAAKLVTEAEAAALMADGTPAETE